MGQNYIKLQWVAQLLLRGVGRVVGANVGVVFVPVNADKIDGAVSWSSGISIPSSSFGFELDYIKGATPQIDMTIGGRDIILY